MQQIWVSLPDQCARSPTEKVHLDSDDLLLFAVRLLIDHNDIAANSLLLQETGIKERQDKNFRIPENMTFITFAS